MATQQTAYMAYLLRLWGVRNGEEIRWLASLQDVRGGQLQGFASPEDLFEFLRARMEVRMEDDETDSDDELR